MNGGRKRREKTAGLYGGMERRVGTAGIQRAWTAGLDGGLRQRAERREGEGFLSPALTLFGLGLGLGLLQDVTPEVFVAGDVLQALSDGGAVDDGFAGGEIGEIEEDLFE